MAFDSQTINHLHEMPNIEIYEYQTFMQEQVDYIEILNTLCHRGATWKTNLKGELMNFKAAFLKNDSSAWFLLVASRIISSGHNSDVTKDRVSLACIAF